MDTTPRVHFSPREKRLSFSRPTPVQTGAEGFVVTEDLTDPRNNPASPKLKLSEQDARLLRQVQQENANLDRAKHTKRKEILAESLDRRGRGHGALVQGNAGADLVRTTGAVNEEVRRAAAASARRRAKQMSGSQVPARRGKIPRRNWKKAGSRGGIPRSRR